MKKRLFWVLTLLLLALMPAQNVLADYCTYSGYKNNSERNLNSFTLTDGTNSATVYSIQTSYGAVYVDKTSSVLFHHQ